MADGDVDATLEVWPSGHLKDRKDYIEKAGTVVDGGELGSSATSGGSSRPTSSTRTPTWRPGKASRTTPTRSRRPRPVTRAGSWAPTRPTRSSTRPSSRASAWTSQVIYSGSEAASLAALDKAYNNQRPDPDVLRGPRSGPTPSTTSSRSSSPPMTSECESIAAEDPTRRSYDCDYAEDVLYKAFSARAADKDAGCVRVPVELRAGPRQTRTRSPWRSRRGRTRPRPRRRGSTRTTTSVQAWLPQRRKQR